MRLLEIVNGMEYKILGKIELDIVTIEIDSRKVDKNSMFICLKGENFDGNDFILDAIDNGASVIVTENDNFKCSDVTVVYVKDARKAYSLFSNNLFDNPDKKMKMIAVVGTNGKTTTTYILQSVLQTANKKVGVIGTLGIEFCGQKIDTSLTTPDCYELNKYLYLMQKSGVEYVVMELSAHAIFYNKTYGIVFDYGILTNFSEDHLDFFDNMYSYGMTKLSFFNSDNVVVAIVNADDLLGKTILTNNIKFLHEKYYSENANNGFFTEKNYYSKCNKFKNLVKISYGINNPSDVFAIDISLKNGLDFIVNAFDNILEIKSCLFGMYNVYNLLSAITLLETLGINYNDIYNGILSLKNVEGRLNLINYDDKKIVIDFAHTEDGLKNLLQTVKSLTNGRIITLFGCGGNRDKQKRPLMGKVASNYSNYVILTSDNPRNENPIDIINDIEKGMYINYSVITDRFDAIKYGISLLKPNDILVIAGRGGEIHQEICGKTIPFNDKEVVHKILGLDK